MPEKIKRPVPLVFIMIYTVWISIIHLVGSIDPVFKGAANHQALFLGLLYFFMGVAGPTSAIGLWMLFSWANLLTRIIYVISICIGFWGMLVSSTSSNLVFELFNIGLQAWIIWYLMRTETKVLFGSARPQAG